jgi:CubicO group peptidase (beta-lactamase class C family)
MILLNKSHEKRIDDLINTGVMEKVYPGCVLLVAAKGKVNYFKESGYLSLIPSPVSMKRDTIFDLASLTKPLATTLVIMDLVDKKRIGLDQPLSELIISDLLRDKEKITLRLLLNHSSGLIDWVPFYLELVNYDPEKRKRVLRESIIKRPLEYHPGQDCIYSDLGFMLLEWIIEETTGADLDQYLINKFYGPLSLKRTFLNKGVPPFERDKIAATEDCPWRKKIIQGEVHDENAYAVGGFSGHSGLFSTAEEVFILVNMLKDHYYGRKNNFLMSETVREFFKRQEVVKGCTWALGWDTPSKEGSSSGSGFSSNSVGHLGFSGTSVWMDIDRDIIVVFLTNRIHPTRDNQGLKLFRPRLHDLIMEAYI